MTSVSLAFLLAFIPYAASATDSVTVNVPSDTLSQSVISASRIIKKADRVTYVISDVNRLKSFDIFSLFAQLPNIKYDNITEKISINGQEDIAFVLDGVNVSKQELFGLSTDQVKSVSVIHTPKGQYVSQGIKYVIEIHKKKEIAFLANIKNSIFIAPENIRTAANEQPGIQLQYSRTKFNINAGYMFGDICWGYNKEEKRILPDGTEYVSNPPERIGPEELTKTLGHSAYLRASYDFNENHSLSTSVSYSWKKLGTVNTTNLKNAVTGMHLNEVIKHNSIENNIAASMTYNASLSEKISMNLSANWNRIASPEQHTYIFNDSTEDFSDHDKTKDYSYQNADFSYNINNSLSLNFGINNIYNRYRIQDRNTGTTVFDRKSVRFDTYGYVTYDIRKDLSLNGGISAGYVKDGRKNRFYISPSLSLNYYPESVFGLSATYNIRPSYPTQEELNPVLRHIGENLYMQGNPELPSVSLTHFLLLQMSFFQNLTFTNCFSGTPNLVSEYYVKNGNDIISTYSSVKHWYNVTGIDYKWEISPNWSWDNSIQLNVIRTFNDEASNKHIGLMGTSCIEYFSPRLKLFSQLRYSRSLSRIPNIYGYSETGFDIWDITVTKTFFKGRLVFSLNYTIPLKVGIRKNQKNVTDSPFYFRQENLDLGIYDNMVIFRVSYSFGKGKKTKALKDNTLYDEESANLRGLL